jgi:hypothetical protein
VSRPVQSQVVDQLPLFLHLLAQEVQFDLLQGTNNEAAFGWPATGGAKVCGVSKLKTTIQTRFDHRYHLSFLSDQSVVDWGNTAFFPFLEGQTAPAS